MTNGSHHMTCLKKSGHGKDKGKRELWKVSIITKNKYAVKSSFTFQFHFHNFTRISTHQMFYLQALVMLKLSIIYYYINSQVYQKDNYENY